MLDSVANLGAYVALLIISTILVGCIHLESSQKSRLSKKILSFLRVLERVLGRKERKKERRG